MKSIEAKEVIKTLNWIAQTNEDGEPALKPIFNKDKGIYECIIQLPLINKTVIGIGDNKLEAIDNATQQSSKLIDSYLLNHPHITLKDFFGGDAYLLEENDGGSLTIRLSTKK